MLTSGVNGALTQQRLNNLNDILEPRLSRSPAHAVLEPETTFKKWSMIGTIISGLYMLSRVKRDQKRKNRLANSFFMLISNFRIKISGGGRFEVRYFNLFLVPAPKQKRLEKWAWRHWKALFL